MLARQVGVAERLRPLRGRLRDEQRDVVATGIASTTVECPPGADGWRATLDSMHRHVGWRPGQGALGARVHEACLPVNAAGATSPAA